MTPAHTFTNDIYRTDWEGRPGKENETIECAKYLIEKNSYTKCK